MNIISYNVNGIRAAVNKDWLAWLKQANPDVVCVQEIKAQPAQIPVAAIAQLGYHCYWFSAAKAGYSGVGLMSKTKPDQVVTGAQTLHYEQEGRVLRADFGALSILSVYVPSGTSGSERQRFKMQWLGDFTDYITELRQQKRKLILAGDFNICHHPIDIHDPIGNKNSSGFLPEERNWLSAFLDMGFVDTFRHFCADPHRYSWWTYRARARARNKGWRIDYHLASADLIPQLQGAAILSDVHHSDHCPVQVTIDETV